MHGRNRRRRLPGTSQQVLAKLLSPIYFWSDLQRACEQFMPCGILRPPVASDPNRGLRPNLAGVDDWNR